MDFANIIILKKWFKQRKTASKASLFSYLTVINFLNYPIAIVLALFIPIYATVIFYLFIRRHYQPLKNRGSSLLIISCAGNKKILDNNYHR